VPTEVLVNYLEKPDRTSEAELLVAAFRSNSAPRVASAPASRRMPAPKRMAGVATGMGMVDVMHEMRDMEQRVRLQIDDLQQKVHAMVADALKNPGVPREGDATNPLALQQAMAQVAHMMDEAAKRFDALLQKPMAMIEKQMEQQRYMFEEAHRQKDFLERMFADLMQAQRQELKHLAQMQMDRLEHLIKAQMESNMAQKVQLAKLEHAVTDRLDALAHRMKSLNAVPTTTNDQKEGEA
jgi:hypothetical protein